MKNKKSSCSIGIHQRLNPRFKRSVLAMCVMALSAPSFAQEESENIEEIIVSGTRANLQNAQEIKRNADTFVDSISAADIGSLPDRSVLEAMQRLPGVSIERFAGKNDPDHFGVEGSGAVIRGMTATRSEFNGRDSFSANSGRGLSFQDVPPELMGGVDIYKNQSADMIEGGIGGTVSLRTRKPFDSNDRVIAVSADAAYGDMQEKWTPTYSALYSDRWETGAGEFGVLLNVSDSELRASSHGIQTDLYEVRTDVQNIAGADGYDFVILPNGSNVTEKIDDRYRKGYAAAFQWENPDDTLLATLQFMRSDAELAWTENAIKYQTGYGRGDTQPLTGTEFEFEDFGNYGVFTGGTLTQDGSVGNSGGWRSNQPDRIPQSTSSDNNIVQYGHQFQTDARYKSTHTIVDDYAFNLKWTPDDNWEHSLDVQYIDASTKDDDVTLMFGAYAMQNYQIGSTPSLEILDPYTAMPAVGETYREEIMTAERQAQLWPFANNPQYFETPSSYYWRAAMDHYERSEGDSLATRLDTTYNIEDGGLLHAVKAGVRFAERDQTIKNSRYNWGQLAAPWGPGGAAFLDTSRSVDNGLANEYQVVDWSDFYRGGVLSIAGDNKTLHPSKALVRDYANWGSRLSGVNNEWDPANARDADNDGVIENVDGYFVLPEILSTTETNKAAYVRMDFGSDDTAMRFSGNIGLRYVKLDSTTSGAVQFPDLVSEYPIPVDAPTDLSDLDALVAYSLVGAPEDNPATADVNEQVEYQRNRTRWAGHANNFISAEQSAFGDNAFYLIDTEDSFDDWLPSFNLKLELTDELVSRFAISKAIALPDIGDKRNYTAIGVRNGQVEQTIYPRENEDASVFEPTRIQTATISGWTATTGNPFLKPMESIQYDASLEWYFDEVGSLTTSLFYKDLSNFIVNDVYYRDFTNPDTGETENVAVGGPINTGNGTMQGFEIAYQQFYDMLPEPWDGLGLQLNYTYIKAEGVPNSLTAPENPDGSAEAGDVQFGDTLPLQGQSKDTYNIVGMYEKYGVSVRVAYNWRSKYLLTTRDVITGLPIYNDDSGFMDASIFYNINDNIKVGLQGTNLLNTKTRTYMQIDAEGTELGRSWFVNDRRYAVLIQASF